MSYKSWTIATLLALVPCAAYSQEMPQPTADCALTDASLPAALSGWTKRTMLTSAAQASGLEGATLPLGRGITVALRPTREVSYAAQPEKPGGSVAHGGMVAFSIPDPGTYQVSLSSGAWIDVLKAGAPLVSAAHAPGPKCSSIRKTVAFLLQPGRYVLQISASADPTLTVMVTRVP